MDEKISDFLRNTREKEGLSRADLASMLGLSVPVYGRYERAFSRMTVARMVHLCELLGFLPSELLLEAAPHLFGRTAEEAQERATLTKIVQTLPHDTVKDLIRLLGKMQP